MNLKKLTAVAFIIAVILLFGQNEGGEKYDLNIHFGGESLFSIEVVPQGLNRPTFSFRLADFLPVVSADASTSNSPASAVTGVRLSADGRFAFPLQIATLKSGWSHDHWRESNSDAVDIFAPEGSSVLAYEDGTLARNNNTLGGNACLLRGESGRSYYYAHLQRPCTSGKVRVGQQIGEVGRTGDASSLPSSAAHLHFSISTTDHVNPNINAAGDFLAKFGLMWDKHPSEFK